MAGQRIWRTRDGRHVPDGHPDAAVLAYGPAAKVPDAVVAELKQHAKPEDKAITHHEDKAADADRDEDGDLPEGSGPAEHDDDDGDDDKPEPSAAEMRRWAKSERIAVPARGRLPDDVIDRYKAAHK